MMVIGIYESLHSKCIKKLIQRMRLKVPLKKCAGIYSLAFSLAHVFVRIVTH